MFALGFTNYWDTYFAGRSAPLGLTSAEVVDALFYNFAPGEVARHIPKVWGTTTPESALAARQTGCSNALRRILGERVDAPAFARAAELLIKAATSAPIEGRPMYDARCEPSRSPKMSWLASFMQPPYCASIVATGTLRPS